SLRGWRHVGDHDGVATGRRFRPGDRPGLQNRGTADPVVGGFDSRSPPRRAVRGRCAVTDPRRRIPRTDSVLADPRLTKDAEVLGRDLVKSAVVEAQHRARAGEIAPEDVADAADAALSGRPCAASSLRPVLNATGVVVHTNLGRAPLSQAAVDAVRGAAGHTDVEFDLATGA